MSVKLSKGHRINLSKDAPGLIKVAVGLGWDVNPTDTGTEFDLDASVFMLGDNGKIPEDEYFVFYNNLKSQMVPSSIGEITELERGKGMMKQ